MNLVEIFKKFPTQKKCIEHLEKIKWKDKPVCPYCSYLNNCPTKDGLRHHCNTCNNSFSVTIDTIFHQTHLPLQKWFLAITLILNAKKGISSRQLARDLEVNKDTAWRMQMQIRNAMVETPSLMSGLVEMDETYIGGKKKRKKDDDESGQSGLKRGRGTNKTPVVGVIQRGGKVNAQIMHRLSFKDLKEAAANNIDFDNAVLMTDDFTGYIPFKNLLPHHTVNHSRKEYAKGIIHTNTIESFWAILKRGITGQYHHLSNKYLNRYIQEFCFRYNNRKNPDVFGIVISNALAPL